MPQPADFAVYVTGAAVNNSGQTNISLSITASNDTSQISSFGISQNDLGDPANINERIRNFVISDYGAPQNSRVTIYGGAVYQS